MHALLVLAHVTMKLDTEDCTLPSSQLEYTRSTSNMYATHQQAESAFIPIERHLYFSLTLSGIKGTHDPDWWVKACLICAIILHVEVLVPAVSFCWGAELHAAN